MRNDVGVAVSKLPFAAILPPDVRVAAADLLARLRTRLLHNRLRTHCNREIAVHFHAFDVAIESAEIDDSGFDQVKRCVPSDENLIVRPIDEEIRVPEIFNGGNVAALIDLLKQKSTG